MAARMSSTRISAWTSINGSLFRRQTCHLTNSQQPLRAPLQLCCASKRYFQDAATTRMLCSAGDSQRPSQQRGCQFRGFPSGIPKIPGFFSPFSGNRTRLNLSPRNMHRSSAAANFSTSAVVFKEAIDYDTTIKPKIEGTDAFIVPEPPAVPEVGEMILQGASSNLAELGLATYWPPGLMRMTFDYIHLTFDIPWWGTIALATVVARLCLFPLVIKAQKNAALMQKNMPEMQRLQMRMSDARQRGDVLATAQTAHELQQFMKKEGVNPLKSMLPGLAQAPIFMSFFFALRSMANAPVESMKEGGLWWFTDLTVADPYYALPIMTSLTLFAVIELGVDGAMVSNQMVYMRYFMRAVPLITLVFTSGFPTAVLVYWFTSNVVSLLQAAVLKVPSVRAKLNIPPLIKHNPEDLPMKKKGMKETFRESMQNSRIAREIDDRQRVDAVNFRQAGLEPIRKTFKYDPTKPRATTKSAVPARKADN